MNQKYLRRLCTIKGQKIRQMHIHKVSYVYKHFIGHSYNKPTVSVDYGIRSYHYKTYYL